MIFFDFNRAQLKPTEVEKLLSVKDFLKDSSVEVHGYACPVGSSYYNSGLSAKRAQTVADWLVLHGVKVTKIQGHGETDQFGRTKKDYWLNRRVELKTQRKGGE
ncbi:OmpA family protein [Thermodesulfovibrio yellowstonii]|uniref:OmpA family protein n=1 Tax=Thermodesulfovibrio yellowstonii TaxID=28262 RepID=UPI000686CF1B|nr:OmpA family protein [Thermodesulfovibrio islandicus]